MTPVGIAPVVDLEHRQVHGVIFFPRWMANVEHSGTDDDAVIACAPSDLPAGYAERVA